MYEKEGLLESVKSLLVKSSFNFTTYHGCFDVAAKREKLLLIKVLLNIDSFQESQATNLKSLSSVLDGTPIIVGMHTRSSKLEKGVVYHRFSIPAVSFNTFQDMIAKNEMPIIYSERGGLFIEIDSNLLKQNREKNYTQEDLAKLTGVTKKSIYEHESRDMKAMSDVAKKIQTILGEEVSKPFQFVKFDSKSSAPSKNIQKDVFDKMEKLGFNVSYIKQSPVNLVAKENILLLSDVEADKRKMKRDAPAVKGLSQLLSSPAVLITEKSKSETIEGVPVIQKEELRDIKKTKDIIKIVRERKG